MQLTELAGGKVENVGGLFESKTRHTNPGILSYKATEIVSKNVSWLVVSER